MKTSASPHSEDSCHPPRCPLNEAGDESIELGPSGDACPTDLTTDGVISVDDLLALLSDFGCLSGCQADIDLDEAVTISDLLVLLGAFGTNC